MTSTEVDAMDAGSVRAAYKVLMNDYQQALAKLSQQAPAEQRCEYCDGTGDVHGLDGEWRGECHCQKPAPAQDEREVAAVIGFYEGEREPRLLSWNVLPNGEHRLYTRPAQAAPLRYTNDGALAECPCCGSLDVGGAHDTVHCYRCGLTVTKPRPLHNAIAAWNARTGRVQAAPQPEQSAVLERVKLTSKEAKYHSAACVAYWNNAVTACIVALAKHGEKAND